MRNAPRRPAAATRKKRPGRATGRKSQALRYPPASAWADLAAKLGEAFPRAALHPAVLRWAEASSRRASWSVAFSGGADSLLLLLLLWVHWPERRSRVVALHFNHRLRGAEADADERFCAAVCAELNIVYKSDSWSEASPAASEAAARAARHEFFRRHGRALWFGHQQDDIAETMLMRLARGSGSGGLAAPRPVQPMPGRRVHLRPLLTLKKSAIADELRRAGATWREDATNAAPDFFRNRVRHAVVPAWTEAARRDAVAGAALSRGLLEEDDLALEDWAARSGCIEPDRRINVSKFSIHPRAVRRRILYQWFAAQRVRLHISRQAFEALLIAVERGVATRQSLGDGRFAVLAKGHLALVAAPNIYRKFPG